MDAFMPYYSNIHRGHGYPSKYSSHVYEQCRETILDFVGANRDEFVCIFGKNTTECLNKLSWCFTSAECKCSSPKDVILLTKMEHHSNLLPWRKGDHITLDYVGITPEGKLDLDDLQVKLQKYGSRISLVSVSGASNVTGIVNPISTISKMVHQVGAFLCVDGAQLVPHKQVNMEQEGIDFLCFSGHKMYAPFGVGVLVGRKDFFNKHTPCMVGGGEVELVTKDKVVWKSTPEKEEEGTPNVVGSVALAESVKILQEIGMDKVFDHEKEMYRYAYDKISEIPGITIVSLPPSDDQIGIFTFIVDGVHYNLVGTVLSDEYGIGTRSGCFCSHIYIQSLFGIPDKEITEIVRRVEDEKDKRGLPGFVRASFSLYTTKEDVDRLYSALVNISQGKYSNYEQEMNGDFVAV
jgi:Selenocysteine lyase